MAASRSRRPGHPDSAAPTVAAMPDSHGKASFWTLALGAVGVVYGDIGTSPLYAMRETVAAASGGTARRCRREAVIGILSLLLWALVLTVTVKYVFILLRADNNGEGGSLTLVALAQRALGRRSAVVLAMGMAGAALFYGDAAITPAISVLSAVEGLKLVTPAFEHYVLPIALVHPGRRCSRCRAAARAGSRPSSARSRSLWFLAMAASGSLHIADDPGVFRALNPYYGVAFLVTHPAIAFAVLGQRLPRGHRARRRSTPISAISAASRSSAAWIAVVFPALTLNYLGQGALLLSDPKAIENPFFLLAPELAPAAARHPGDARHHRREPGGDHRRLLADAAGGAARPPAAPRGPLHLRDPSGPDLPAAGERCSCSSS